MVFEQKDRYGIEDLLSIVRLLRSPGGCPWDREQTHQSIRRNFLEETCEACEAIDNGDMDLLREELGDVLLQVAFHAEMERERGSFDFGGVCDGICRKLITRHPHVFGDAQAGDSAGALDNWEEIKRQEKNQQTHTEALQSVSRALPALMRSEKVQHRAARTGFDYVNIAGAMADLRSEVDELFQAVENGGKAMIAEELGDVLFSAVNVARFAQVDGEQALTDSCDKFIRRFSRVEAIAERTGVDLASRDIDQLNDLWREAKIQE